MVWLYTEKRKKKKASKISLARDSGCLQNFLYECIFTLLVLINSQLEGFCWFLSREAHVFLLFLVSVCGTAGSLEFLRGDQIILFSVLCF